MPPGMKGTRAITPVTSMPANGVSPSGMLTSALPQIRLQAVTTDGGSRLTLIQKSEGGDWFKVPALRVLSGSRLGESKAVLDLIPVRLVRLLSRITSAALLIMCWKRMAGRVMRMRYGYRLYCQRVCPGYDWRSPECGEDVT